MTMTLFSSNSLRLPTFFTQTWRQFLYLPPHLRNCSKWPDPASAGTRIHRIASHRTLSNYFQRLIRICQRHCWRPRWRPNSFNGQHQRTFMCKQEILNASITDDRTNSSEANTTYSPYLYTCQEIVDPKSK